MAVSITSISGCSPCRAFPAAGNFPVAQSQLENSSPATGRLQCHVRHPAARTLFSAPQRPIARCQGHHRRHPCMLSQLPSSVHHSSASTGTAQPLSAARALRNLPQGRDSAAVQQAVPSSSLGKAQPALRPQLLAAVHSTVQPAVQSGSQPPALRLPAQPAVQRESQPAVQCESQPCSGPLLGHGFDAGRSSGLRCSSTASVAPEQGATGRSAAPSPHRRATPPQRLNATAQQQLAPALLQQLGRMQQRLGSRAAALAAVVCFTAAWLAVAPPATAATAATTAGATATASQVLAVALGWAVLLGSCFRSVPQIVKMVRANSAEGLSLTSIATETLCYTATLAYNINHKYPFNTYGDTVACWLQDLIILALILKPLALHPVAVAAGSVGFAALSFWLFFGGVPMHILEFLQCFNLVFSVLGVKAPQIMLNWRRGDTGLLSLTTCILNIAGNVARVFTTWVLTKDMLILWGYVLLLCLNLVLLVQTAATRAAKKKGAGAGAGAGDAKGRVDGGVDGGMDGTGGVQAAPSPA